MEDAIDTSWGGCLIDIEFDGSFVLQAHKEGVMPLDVLMDELKQNNPARLQMLEVTYVNCRMVATGEHAQNQDFPAEIRRILTQRWGEEEIGRSVTCTARLLTPDEVEKIFAELPPRETAEKAAEPTAAEEPDAEEASAEPAPRRSTLRKSWEPKESKTAGRVTEQESESEKVPTAEDASAGEMTAGAKSARKAGASAKKESALEAIHRLVGAEEFKSLADELTAVAPLIRETKTGRAFRFQHFLLAINDGGGLTTALRRLSDLVQELGLVSFSGKRTVHELTLDPPGNDENEPLRKLQEHLQRANHFQGVICLDISAWIGRVQDKKFQNLLRVIRSTDEDCLFVFRVPYIAGDVLTALQKGIGEVLYTRPITFVPLSNEEYGVCAERLLAECHFALAEDAWPLFYERLAADRSGARFYGLSTVEKLVDEMLYRKLVTNSRTGSDGLTITAADLEGLVTPPAAETGLAELEEMVGMEHIRDRILEMVAQVELQRELMKTGRSPERPCLHMRFVGSPGTGKTTVARIVGRILKEKGILEIGNFYEVSGRSLCGRYVGETAPKTSEICRNAYGSVLFIDESYSLYAGDDNSRDYGKEAIDTLIAEMENNRDKMVVIMSGYPDEMETLMKANPGLAGRMPYEIRFPNYTREQLTRIFLNMAGKAFSYDEPFRQAAERFFASISDGRYKAKSFSNARLARNLYERVWAKAATRHQLNKDAPLELLPEDLTGAVEDQEFQQLLKTPGGSMGFAATLETEH